MNIGFFSAPVVVVMLVWMGLCFLMYPMTWAVTLPKILITAPFWIPVLSFGAMLYQQWDLETRLLSVCKFVENDVEWANSHMLESFFLRDYVAEQALKNIIKTLDKQNPKPQLTMGQYIMLICEEAERMHFAGEEPDEALASKTLVASWSSRYWVKLILYSEYLADEEGKKFTWWFGIYKVFTTVMILFFLTLAFVTVVAHLHQQAVLPSSPLTEWVHLDYLDIFPYNPGQVPGTSQANAVAATVTTGGYHYIRDLDRLGEGRVTGHPPPKHERPRPVSGPGVPTKHPSTPKKAADDKRVEHATQSREKTADDKRVEHTAQTSRTSSSFPPVEKGIVPFGSRKQVTAEAGSRTPSEKKDNVDKTEKKDTMDKSEKKVTTDKSEKKDKDNSKLIDHLLDRFDKPDKVKRRTALTSQANNMRSTAL
jgi:hypothetical protein